MTDRLLADMFSCGHIQFFYYDALTQAQHPLSRSTRAPIAPRGGSHTPASNPLDAPIRPRYPSLHHRHQHLHYCIYPLPSSRCTQTVSRRCRYNLPRPLYRFPLFCFRGYPRSGSAPPPAGDRGRPLLPLGSNFFGPRFQKGTWSTPRISSRPRVWQPPAPRGGTRRCVSEHNPVDADSVM